MRRAAKRVGGRFAPIRPAPVIPPHCDSRILHGPSEGCEFCNDLPEWQSIRVLWGINFTGEYEPGKLPCPAEAARDLSMINQWPGNVVYDQDAGIPSPEQVDGAIVGLQEIRKELDWQ